MRLWPARLAYLLGVGLLGAIYHLVPSARAVASVAIGVMAIAAIGLGTTAFRPPRRGAWGMLAVTVALTTAANVTYVIAADRGPLPAYPALFDVLAVVQYLPAAIALLWLGQPQQPSRDYGMLLDIVNLSLAGSLVLWVTVVRAAVDLPSLSASARLLTVAGWVGFVATLSALVRILVDWRRNKAMLLVGAGVLTFLVADVIYLVNLFYGTRADSAADIGYVLSNALSA